LEEKTLKLHTSEIGGLWERDGALLGRSGKYFEKEMEPLQRNLDNCTKIFSGGQLYLC
jgi:hypothetical protein